MNASLDPVMESVVTVADPLNVATVEEVRVRLAAALDASATVVVDLTAVTAIDLYAVQLLCAAQRSASLRGKRLELRGADSLIRTACAATAVEPAALGLTLPTLSP